MKYLTVKLLHLIHLATRKDCGTAHARRKHPQSQHRQESDFPGVKLIELILPANEA